LKTSTFILGFLAAGGILLHPFPSKARSKVVPAASPAYADVLSAVTAASSGDAVLVPAGSATWTNHLVIKKGIFLIGAGIGKTVITSNYSSSNDRLDPARYLIVYYPDSPGLDEPFRLSGFTFDCGAKCYPVFLLNGSSSPITKIRVDHIRTLNPNGLMTIAGSGAVWGVADNNIFDGGYTSVDGYDGEWSIRGFAFGTANMFYFEDNTFIGRGDTLIIRSEQAAKWCARHNLFDGQYMTDGTYPWFDMHGNLPNSWHSVMGVEIYDNTINLGSFGCSALDQRGGKALYYNNTVVGSAFIQVREEYNDSLMPPANNAVTGQPQHVSDSY
jgi:hypothetical protein